MARTIYKIQPLVEQGVDFSKVLPEKQAYLKESVGYDFGIEEIVQMIKTQTNNFQEQNAVALDLDTAIYNLYDEWLESTGQKAAPESIPEPEPIPEPIPEPATEEGGYKEAIESLETLLEFTEGEEKKEVQEAIEALQVMAEIEEEEFAQGGRIKDADIKVGERFELRNGDIIEIKRLFTENIDEDWVEYTRNGETHEGSVKALRMFINRVAGYSYAQGGKVDSDKWIQGVGNEMEEKGTEGAFTKQALRHGMTPIEYAKEVLANPTQHTLTTRRRAQFVKNINPESFKNGGSTYQGGGEIKVGEYLWDENGKKYIVYSIDGDTYRLDTYGTKFGAVTKTKSEVEKLSKTNPQVSKNGSTYQGGGEISQGARMALDEAERMEKQGRLINTNEVDEYDEDNSETVYSLISLYSDQFPEDEEEIEKVLMEKYPKHFSKGGSINKGGKVNNDKWIQGVGNEMEEKGTEGAFTKQALRHGMTPVEYAKEVLANPTQHTLTTRRRAQFVKNINPESFKNGGSTYKDGGEIKQGDIILPYAHSDKLEIKKIFKNKDGETSYIGKRILDGKEYELILNSKDKIVSTYQDGGEIEESELIEHYNFYVDNIEEDEEPLSYEEWKSEYADDLKGLMAKGGATKKKKSYAVSKKDDQDRKAKPAGYRFKDKFVRDKRVKNYKRPTVTQIIADRKKPIKQRKIYFEARPDHSDKDLRKKLAEGGEVNPLEGIASDKEWTRIHDTYAMFPIEHYINEARILNDLIEKDSKNAEFYQMQLSNMNTILPFTHDADEFKEFEEAINLELT